MCLRRHDGWCELNIHGEKMEDNEENEVKAEAGDGTENQGYFGILTQRSLTFSLQIRHCHLGNPPATGLLHIVCCCVEQRWVFG